MHRNKKRYQGYEELMKTPSEDVRRAGEIDRQESMRQSKNLAKILQVQNDRYNQGINVVRKMKAVDSN